MIDLHCHVLPGEEGGPATAEDGLDDLIDGVYDGMVVDRATWEGYQRRKPARSQRLKVIQRHWFEQLDSLGI